ncbi:MAG: fumarylacetoacetate hydrolase family protein, partial [Gammaproteobacteria bacterium]|nr:fumarylacetoacetate hydrolase family protein [Gammaproteobacteria bacterium]
MLQTRSIIITICFSAFSFGLFAQSTTPFKLGSFSDEGREFVGAVLENNTVIDITAANVSIALGEIYVASPIDMKDLINRYDAGLRIRIIEIINSVNTDSADSRPSYVYSLNDLKILPPIMYPKTMMNTALNYTEHALEMEDVRDDGVDGSTEPGYATPGTRRPASIWEPSVGDRRWNPYMFIKLPSAIIAHGESIQVPQGREQIDWECELGVVIGKTAKSIRPGYAADYIFGYTLEMDVSDREGRGDTRYGSDWLIGKSRDTFAPMGPFITPKEFITDPTNLDITFVLNGRTMQESNTNLMIHNVFEQVMYASNIATLLPGDVLATGTPSGVGSARTPP